MCTVSLYSGRRDDDGLAGAAQHINHSGVHRVVDALCILC